MHNQMLITLNRPADADSETVRQYVFDQLLNDKSFCGEGGRFSSPVCDWFVIGGRWSGCLTQLVVDEGYKDAVRARFPEADDGYYSQSFVDQNAAEFDAIWQSHGGTGPSPFTRCNDEHGYPDDAMLLTQAMYDKLLSEYAGQAVDRDGYGYADLDLDELQPDFVGRKWLVVVDYHN